MLSAIADWLLNVYHKIIIWLRPAVDATWSWLVDLIEVCKAALVKWGVLSRIDGPSWLSHLEAASFIVPVLILALYILHSIVRFFVHPLYLDRLRVWFGNREDCLPDYPFALWQTHLSVVNRFTFRNRYLAIDFFPLRGRKRTPGANARRGDASQPIGDQTRSALFLMPDRLRYYYWGFGLLFLIYLMITEDGLLHMVFLLGVLLWALLLPDLAAKRRRAWFRWTNLLLTLSLILAIGFHVVDDFDLDKLRIPGMIVLAAVTLVWMALIVHVIMYVDHRLPALFSLTVAGLMLFWLFLRPETRWAVTTSLAMIVGFPAFIHVVLRLPVLMDIKEGWPDPLIPFFESIPANRGATPWRISPDNARRRRPRIRKAEGQGGRRVPRLQESFRHCVRRCMAHRFGRFLASLNLRRRLYSDFVLTCLNPRPIERQPVHYAPSGSHQAAFIRLATIELFNPGGDETTTYQALARWLFYYSGPVWSSFSIMIVLLFFDVRPGDELIILALFWWLFATAFFLIEFAAFTAFLNDRHLNDFVLPYGLQRAGEQAPAISRTLNQRWSRTVLTALTTAVLFAYLQMVEATTWPDDPAKVFGPAVQTSPTDDAPSPDTPSAVLHVTHQDGYHVV